MVEFGAEKGHADNAAGFNRGGVGFHQRDTFVSAAPNHIQVLVLRTVRRATTLANRTATKHDDERKEVFIEQNTSDECKFQGYPATYNAVQDGGFEERHSIWKHL